MFILLAHLLPSFLPPCVHLSGHFMSCSCCPVQSSQGGISPRQMVDDVAPILSAELSTPNLNLPPLVHMSLSPGSSVLPGQIPQAINPQNHTDVSAHIFSMACPSRNQTTETLATFGIKDCSGHSAYDNQQDTKLGLYRLQKGNAYRTMWRNTETNFL